MTPTNKKTMAQLKNIVDYSIGYVCGKHNLSMTKTERKKVFNNVIELIKKKEL